MEIKILKTDQDRAAHFKSFIQQLVEKFQPTRIISFGKQTLQNEIEGCFVSKQVKHQHFCLLICMELPTRIDYEVQDFANNHYHSGQITIVCHGESAIKESIESNNRFFITVMTRGKPIYTRDGFLDIESTPKFNPAKSLEKAEMNFFHRIPLAEGFLECAHGCLIRKSFNICTFLLHQAVEQSCIVLIRVYIDYRSEFHNLHRLLGLTRCFSDEPTNLMIGDRPADRRLFDILIKSYGQARYAPEFFVDQKDAGELYSKISSFVQLIKILCRNKMEALQGELFQYESINETENNHEGAG